MRVLHVISNLSSRYGGPVSVLKDLVKEQKISGLDVTIYTTNMDYPKGIYCKPGKRILDTTSNVPVVFHKVTFMPLVYSHSLAHNIKLNVSSYDIVHIHGLYRFPPTYAAYQARKQHVPYLICPHGSLDPFIYRQSTRSLLLKRLYERWFDLPNLHGASAIHYTTKAERQLASFLNLRAPSFVVPVGIDWARYQHLPERGAFRAAQGLDDAPLVLFFGRINFVKGLDLLIPAFDALKRKMPDVRLAIVGPENDDYGQKVRGWVSERGLSDAVCFVGQLDGEAVLQAYVDADVFVLPSYTESFGMTAVEAMACGVPVVISDQVKIHAEVEGSGAGLVTRCNATEVTEALDGLLRDAPRRQAMGAAGRAFARQRYNWDRIVVRLTEEYKVVIARGSGDVRVAR